MEFRRLKSSEEIRDLVVWHNVNSDFVTLDTETTSVNPRESKLLDIQISGKSANEAVIFEADYAKLLLELAPGVVLVAHNYKFDAHVLFLHGVDLLDRVWRDTILLGHLVNENRESYSLDSYVKELWNDDFKERFWAKHKAYEAAPEEEKVDYACRDIVYTRRLFVGLTDSIRRAAIPDSLIEHVHRLQASLLRTEIEGLEVDTEYLIALGVKLKGRMDEIEPQMKDSVKYQVALWEAQAYEKAREIRKTEKGKAGVKWPSFNFSSSSQLQWLLYEALELPVQLNEKTKQVSTDYDAMQKIKHLHPVVDLLQEYRDLSKVHTSFIEGTNDRLDQGRIYPEFRVNGTKTGRISHSNPNLGQLPKSGGVRGIYRPKAGSVFISADYSQLEVCIEANLTGDVQLARIFQEGLSKHDITATELRISRDQAKTLNFALQYWASHFKVAKLLGVSEDEGKKIWENYWKLYSGPKKLKEFSDRRVNTATPLETAFGRKRRFEARKRSPWDADYRQAYNFLIQGTGADITSRAFYLVSEELRQRSWGRGLFTVHDEILIEVKETHWQEAEKLLLETMVRVGDDLGLKIPLKAESSGPMPRWQD